MPFKEYEQNQLLLLPPSLKSFLPSEHPVHVINEVVEGFDLTQLYDKYSPLGSSAYHPQMMLKVLFYAYVMGERSSRLIAHKLKSDIAYLYLSALQQPDFRTINRFRQENLPLIKDLFLQLVRLCTHIGMVSLGKIALDGTRLKANASYQKTKKLPALEEELKLLEKEIDFILRECEEIDSKEDGIQGEDNSFYELKEELRDKERLKEKLLQAKEKLTSRNMKEINLTDNDCATMLHKGYQPELSYNGLVAVEEKNGLIVSATLTNNASDYEALRLLVEKAETNTNLKPNILLVDSGFTSFANLQYLKDEGIVSFLPD